MQSLILDLDQCVDISPWACLLSVKGALPCRSLHKLSSPLAASPASSTRNWILRPPAIPWHNPSQHLKKGSSSSSLAPLYAHFMTGALFCCSICYWGSAIFGQFRLHFPTRSTSISYPSFRALQVSGKLTAWFHDQSAIWSFWLACFFLL